MTAANPAVCFCETTDLTKTELQHHIGWLHSRPWEERIRELEAELAAERELSAGKDYEYDALKARAERAEKERDEVLRLLNDRRTREEKLKARVAELEDHLRELAKSPGVRNAMLVVKTGGKVW